VADALNMPFEDNAFDLAWSLESGEHMPDKKKFVNELMRVVAPGGRIIIVTWCHRDLERGEPSLSRKEEKILAKINRAYYLPKWCSVDDYVKLLEKEGAVNIKREDWSYIIAPFWKAVIKSSLNMKSVVGLLKSGFSTIRGAYAMLLMLKGFNSGVIKFGLITCTKKGE
jgi:tocopherol O-methyltransferase